MQLSIKLNEMLNEQVLHELKNANIYNQIRCYFEDLGLTGLAGYFAKQSQHETDHANLFITHINDRTGGKVSLENVEAPNILINNIKDVGSLYLETEELTTEKIESLMEYALSSKSYIDVPFLNTMLQEQVEEESEAFDFSSKFNMVGDIVLFDASFAE